MKFFCTFGLVAVAIILGTCAALPAHNKLGDVIMENEQVLDPDGPMIMRWTIINETSEIEMELQTNCTGWMGFVFGNGIGQPGAIGDGVIGGYNDELGLGYIEDRWLDISVASEIKPGGGEFDDNVNVVLVSATYQEPWSIIRFRRNIDTGDSQDVVIRPGPMLVVWTYADSDNTSIPHDPDTPGASYVTFIAQ
ncbi:hypothetical protein DAPPUDRAFT_228636 [Daphnia pulex]|uniref:DOMON domain-containing protein n=1 Tax=Daphnia pulex TaxID=6669 RepID=E9HFD6_DAPPU|nr:hypothetical protein DAPPUDRAFT_228636 [Daphnia pulex]|eukprot:EFX69551.1 hypothetical protein DAPPUDRAFT_228636 [Daphnia pulex]